MDYRKIVRGFKDRSVLVIGDLILDHYIWGRVSRISPEAPVPVVDVTRESFMLGGAANVAHNIVAMGGKAAVVGMIGKDISGNTFFEMLDRKNISCQGIFIENRPTTVKTRVIAHNQQVVRFDREDGKYVGGKILKGVLEYIDAVRDGFDAIIISDYKKGMVSGDLIEHILRKQPKKSRRGSRGTFVAVDPKVGHFDLYNGVSLITPNIMEASHGAGIEIRDEKTLLRAGRMLMRKLNCMAVLITRGEQGMSLFEKKGVTHIPTVARKVYDVTGAGDTVIAAFTLAHTVGATMEEAAIIANHAAGFVVGEVGTAVASPDQILETLRGEK